MTPTLQLLLELVILIAAAKAAGYVATLLKQPAVLGQLLVGLLLGPSLLNIFGWQVFSSQLSEDTIIELAEIGVIFLMFVAGMEVEVMELLQSRRVAVLAGSLGVVVPLIMGAAVAAIAGYALEQSIYIGLILTATSVSISAQTLIELDVLKSREGLALLGAAIADDVLVILALSMFLAFSAGSGGVGDVVDVLVRMAAFFILAALVGLFLLPRLVEMVHRSPISEGVVATAVVTMLLYAWAAEAVGQLAAITGAFIAGMLIGRTRHRREIERGMHVFSYAFFVPLFLVSIGLRIDVRALGVAGLIFSAAIILVAVASKVIGCGLGARLAGMTRVESLRIGVGMVSRGEVGLIVATVGLQRGLIDDSVFAVVVLMVLASTLVTPVLLRWAFARKEKTYVPESAGAGQ